MAIQDFYNLDVAIYRMSYTRNAAGGRSQTRTLQATVRGRQRDMSARELEFLGADSDEIWCKIYCDCDTTIQHLDELTVGSNTWEAIQPGKRQDLQTDHHYEINARRRL